ncbi:MAG: helix-turn-helix transcriptional regulator, partial [Tritonibacter mobilis]|nr:helix-turn-helix transcriptional regulator [Tritonibacter mobilis]
GEIRAEKGMTQAELAKLVGVSRPYLTQIETNKRKLSLELQKQIAEALGVDPVQLVDFSAPLEDEEQFLLSAFRAISEEERAVWLRLAKASLPPQDSEK